MEKELGALWKRSGKNGEYMSGVIEINGVVTTIVLFPIKTKKNERQPDWRIMKAEPKQSEEEKIVEVPQDLNPDDVPF